MPGPNLLLRPDRGRRLYVLYYRVRVSATADGESIKQAKGRALDRMIANLAKQGWQFVSVDPVPESGPYPVVPVKGFGKRPTVPKRKPGQPSARYAPHDDYTWRISTLPQLTRTTARFLTDQVEWEFAATFHRQTMVTEYVPPEEGNPHKLWQPRQAR